MSAPLMQAHGLTRSFTIRAGAFAPRRTLHAVNGVDLEIRKGDVLGIVGESGCGKSTLARVLVGLQRPTQGQVLFRGRPLGYDAASRRELGRAVSVVFRAVLPGCRRSEKTVCSSRST